MLENQGQAFANAAKLTGVNEIYLIAHALLETGNGQSKLAKGANLVNNQVVSNSPIKYYNVYGIGAYDYAPLVNGINYAKRSAGIVFLKLLLMELNLLLKIILNLVKIHFIKCVGILINLVHINMLLILIGQM